MTETGKMESNVVEFPQRKCCQCGARATTEVPLVDMETGAALSKWFCSEHGKPLDETGLRLLLDVRDATIAASLSREAALREALEKIKTLAAGPHPPRSLEDLGDIYGIAETALSTTV